MPIVLTEGDDAYLFRVRILDPDIFVTLYMLGGNDVLTTASFASSLRAYLGAGNDYARIGMMPAANIFGEGGNDTIEINHSGTTIRIDGGDGDDRVNFLTGSVFSSVTGGLGNDVFHGYSHAISGTIQGGAGNDSFFGFGNFSGREVTLAGGAGNDIYAVDPSSPATIIELAGEGVDTVQIATGISYTLAANIENVSVGSLAAGSGSPTIAGNSLSNAIIGGSLGERLLGLDGNDSIRGMDGNDWIDGGAGNDVLAGNAGSDVLIGGSGADQIEGGSGRDRLTGGSGNDFFLFRGGDFAGLTNSTCDQIHDFRRVDGDRIRLDFVDSNSNLDGNQAFAFIGSAAFTGQAGQLRYQQTDGNTYVQGDINGDGSADFVVRLDGLHALAASDFIL